jgi:hypothetical protein
LVVDVIKGGSMADYLDQLIADTNETELKLSQYDNKVKDMMNDKIKPKKVVPTTVVCVYLTEEEIQETNQHFKTTFGQ